MVAMAREQSHSVGIAAHNQTIAVVFDFMHPTRPGGRLGAEAGKAGFHEVLWADATRGHADAVVASSDHPQPSS
jgi:hypothetical protein